MDESEIWEQAKQINFVSSSLSGECHLSLRSQTTSEVGELGRGEIVKMENWVLLTCALQTPLVMLVSGRRLIYSLLCFTPGNIIITIVIMCQCHRLYFSSFSAQGPLPLTPTSFCFPPASPNAVRSVCRTCSVRARGTGAKDFHCFHRSYSSSTEPP